MKKIAYTFLCILFIYSCHSNPEIKDFDSKQWKADHNACEGYRKEHFIALIEQRNELKGRNAAQIHQILGLPNRNELYTRDQKYYFYSISPTKVCENYSHNAQKEFIRLRFNSIGNVNEVTIIKE